MSKNSDLDQVFPAQKYEAVNLMLARCACRLSVFQRPFHYVTVGGTELADVPGIRWMAGANLLDVTSYESDEKRILRAKESASLLSEKGVDVSVHLGDVYGYQRTADEPHCFFLDFCGTFNAPHIPKLRKWFAEEVVRDGDLLMVTSFLSRHPGWPRVLKPFSGEFAYLGVATAAERQVLYYPLHPSLVVYRALLDAGLDGELAVNCIGQVKYSGRGRAPMGIYAFSISEGKTRLDEFVQDTPMFETKNKEWGTVFPSEQS